MKILNSVKKFSKKFLNFKCVKVIVPILVIIPILLFQFSVPAYAVDNFTYTRVPGYINNPLTAFPNATYIYYMRDLDDTMFEQHGSMYSFTGNYLDNTSARFRGQFNSTQQFDTWDNRTGVFKVFLRGNAPINKLYKGDSIRLRASIAINWKASILGTDEDIVSPQQYLFGYLPTRVRAYFACNSASTGEYKAYPIDGLNGDLNYYFEEVPSTGLYSEEIFEEFSANYSRFPSIGLGTSISSTPYFPYRQLVRPYTTYLTGDFTVTLPEDVIINEQPFHICFDTENISGNGKYERVNNIEFEMHNFNMTVLTSPENLALSQLENINQNLNDIFNYAGDPFVPPDINNKYDQFEIDENNMYDYLTEQYEMQDYIFESALSTLDKNYIAGGLAFAGAFITRIVNIPFLADFFYIALPIGALALVATITITIVSKTRNESKPKVEARRNTDNIHKRR